MTTRFVRAAQPGDAQRIADIYNQGIVDRIATFETTLRSEADIGNWFQCGHPVFVAGEAARIMAFAVAFPYRSRSCYDGVREFSVYVARDSRGKGFGRAAMTALMEDCMVRGWWKLLSRVFPENGQSRKLLASLGFRDVGTYEKHAKLDGEWRDVVIVEKLLI
jgi:L-amino acid N-acyltransferase YncA